jgi:hypothetical protein
VRYSSADFDRWAFAIERHRRALHGKTLMLKGNRFDPTGTP